MDISFDTSDQRNESELDETNESDYYSTPKFFGKPIEDKIENKTSYEKPNSSKENQFTLQLAQTINSGVECGNRGEHQLALECFDRAIQLGKNHAEVCGGKGLALLHLERYEEALVCFDRAIQLDDSNTKDFHVSLTPINLHKSYQE